MRKRLVGLALCLALTASMMGSAFAYASYENSDFNFTFDGTLQNTSTRPKDDYTSSWMQVQSITSGKQYIASAQARSSWSSGSNVDVGSPAYTFGSGTTRYMVNYIKESGYSLAGIRAAQYYSDPTFYASGVWSPDSI
jgi:hypothetical protein